jgi:hypothetical protein
LMRERSEAGLQYHYKLLEREPSQQNIDATLKFMAGASTMDALANKADAFKRLEQAAGVLLMRAESAFQRNPTLDNFDKLLEAGQGSAVLGGRIPDSGLMAQGIQLDRDTAGSVRPGLAAAGSAVRTAAAGVSYLQLKAAEASDAPFRPLRKARAINNPYLP